jgi:hypothetical protein
MQLIADFFASGVPFLPHAPLWHPVPRLNQALVRLEIVVLDVVDIVVSKLNASMQTTRPTSTRWSISTWCPTSG